MKNFKNKVAVVTGGGSGIGQAICVELAKEGAHLAVTDFSLERAQTTVEKCVADGGVSSENTIALRADVTSRDSLSDMAEKVRERFGTVELLVANAGITPPQGHAAGRPESDWDFALSVNVMGVIRTVDTFLEDLRENSPNSHCMISASMGGLMSSEGGLVLGAYIPSKFACVGYALELRKQFREEKIGISMLCPGLVYTGMTHNSADVRPQHLGKQKAPSRTDMPDFLRPSAIMPEDAAKEAIKGIQDNRFFVPTHSDSVDRLRPYYESILAEMEGHGATPGI